VSGQRDLFGVESAPHPDGETYDPDLDHARLTGQNQRVFDLMRDGEWRSLDEISRATGDPSASISARLRDLRKPNFGGHSMEGRRVPGGNGLWVYRVTPANNGSRPAATSWGSPPSPQDTSASAVAEPLP